MNKRTPIANAKVKRHRVETQRENKSVRKMSSFFWGVRRSENILTSERNVQIGTMPYKKTR